MSISTDHSVARKGRRSSHILKAFDANFQAKINFALANGRKQETFIGKSASDTPASDRKENRIIESYMLNEAEYLRAFGMY
jgi:hypothetical protein